ncbi:cell adhesion molecule CEACAM2-like [Notamacropus eugenii]|uniref:cell adhesion molecule CEACAM2-like n=1 Tax=Notamacropus eugenii TaxID=9315 RepID=UPI003B678C3A
MESPSQAPHSGGSPWKGLLLTASILSSWIQPTSAQGASVTVVPNPPYGTVGSSVILDIQGISEQPSSYTWHKRTVGNQIAFYRVADGHLSTADNRLNMFSNGSLLISNLRLNDTDNYLVQYYNSTSLQIERAEGYFVVYERVSKPTITANLSVSKDVTVSVEKVSPGRGNGSSFSTGDIAGIVIGVLVGVALTGGLIYFFFFKETGRASKHCHSEKNCSAPKHGEDTTLYENTACEKGSAVSAQGLDSSPAFPQVQSESPYQVLDISQVDVYEKISPWKNPQAEGREKSP